MIVVEQDEQTLRRADETVDLGPGPGVCSGRVVTQGDLAKTAHSKRSITGKHLRGDEEIEGRRKVGPGKPMEVRIGSMPKRIDELSIFGEYGQPENRLTVALLQILKIGGESLIRHFAECLKFEIPSSDIDIFSQAPGKKCIPDGLLESRFSFSLVIESKIRPNAINAKQLAALVDDGRSRGPNSVLLFLTPDASRPKALRNETCNWSSWIVVRDVLRSYLDKPEIDNPELLGFMVEQFHIFGSNLGVLEESWDPDESRVLVVPAANARGIALRFQVYLCQNRRSFKPSKWIAFYSHGQIDTIADIASPPEDNVVPVNCSDLLSFAESLPRGTEPHRILRLRNTRDIGPITNDLLDKNGRPTPWVQYQRYTTIDRIKNARHTSDL